MAKGAGSISLLIDSPLRDLVLALRTVGPEVRKQINTATKADAQTIWFDEVKFRALTMLKQRGLVDTARVGVTNRNVILRSGGRINIRNARPKDNLTTAIEFGGGENRQIKVSPKNRKPYTRRMGPTFGPKYRNGSVVYPAAREAIPRFASLWLQTARRTIRESIERV